MNAQEIEALRQVRVRQGETVKAEVDQHKVCTVCDSISRKSAGFCSICKAYRWDSDPAAVLAAIDRAVQNVFPVTLGYAAATAREYTLSVFQVPSASS